jgi:hypothetical protein
MARQLTVLVMDGILTRGFGLSLDFAEPVRLLEDLAQDDGLIAYAFRREDRDRA